MGAVHVRGSGDHIEARHADEFRRSGVPIELAVAAGVRSVLETEASRMAKARCGAGWAIPYRSLDGEPDAWQVKPDSLRTFSDGHAAKYVWPVGVAPRLFFPPGIEPVLADPTQALLLT